MTRDRFMVLAASQYQIPFVIAAQARGCEVVTVDNRPANPGHQLADRARFADTTDVEHVLQIARREGISGVLAACTDVALPTAARIAAELDLVGPPVPAVDIVCDKLAFRQALRELGLPCPEFYVTQDPDDLPGGLFLGDPWIMKPDRSSGSKGVAIVRSEDEYHAGFQRASVHSPTGRVIVERFLAGAQVTCEGVMDDGRIGHAWILDRQTAEPPFVTTIGHHVPTRVSPAQAAELLSTVESTWRRLGVVDGPFDCDAVLSEDGIHILEMAPRPGGNSIVRLLREYAGFDMPGYAVDHALGRPWAPPEARDAGPAAALVLLGAKEAGYLRYDEVALEELRGVSWVKYIQMDLCSGTAVDAFIDGRGRVGEALVLGDDRDDVDSKALHLRERLAVAAG